jgi:glycosyltransferase involved in cell wall biosynthesis
VKWARRERHGALEERREARRGSQAGHRSLRNEVEEPVGDTSEYGGILPDEALGRVPSRRITGCLFSVAPTVRILIALTYYRPHVSGLTIYAERLARGLVARGHEVTVLTSHYDHRLPRFEALDGVRLVRVPVAFRVSKGVIMPSYGFWATRLVARHDVVSIHLPQFDAWGLALRSKVLRKPSVLTYHCDLQLPTGAFSRTIERITLGANALAGHWADHVVAYTADYAAHSSFLRRFEDKVEVIPPPVVMPEPSVEAVSSFLQQHGLDGEAGRRRGPVLGLAARFAAEKGVETVLDAMPLLLQKFPDLTILFAGQYEGVVGEDAYWKRLAPRIAALDDHWRFVGTLDPIREMPAFYGSLDCLLLPSLNSTESFGLVQVEAMLCGVPVVASDLPGVREPIKLTGMGEIIPLADAVALGDAVSRIVSERSRYARARADIARLFELDACLDRYEELFQSGASRSGRR